MKNELHMVTVWTSPTSPN